jgi:hypothetical protein
VRRFDIRENLVTKVLKTRRESQRRYLERRRQRRWKLFLGTEQEMPAAQAILKSLALRQV